LWSSFPACFPEKEEEWMARPTSRVSRVLMTGPLAPFADAYWAELRERGYTVRSTVCVLPGQPVGFEPDSQPGGSAPSSVAAAALGVPVPHSPSADAGQAAVVGSAFSALVRVLNGVFSGEIQRASTGERGA
jgi:hypothetical protein